MQDTIEEDENDNLNQNLMEGVNEVPNDNNQIPQMESNYSMDNSNNNVTYQNQPSLLNDQITSKIGLNDFIKVEYEKAIFSDFEKIIQYDSFTNRFRPGLDNYLSYPYHFNPTLLTLTRYCKCCDCCGNNNNDSCKNLCDLLTKNFIFEKIIYVFNLLFTVKSIYAFLSLINFPIFIQSLVYFFNEPGPSFLLVLLIYGMTLFFQSQLLFYKLPQPMNLDEFKRKIQQKMQTGQRIYFGDDKKVIPLVYHSYRDISGTLELTKAFNLVVFSGRPGTYFLDGKNIREFNKIDEEFGLRGGNQRYYINYESSPMALNTKLDYDSQTLNSMFSSHEKNELFIQDDELLYLAPQGFKKWDTIPIICFFCLVGNVYNNYFELNLEYKSYKVRKALFFEEPEKELEQKLYKYNPKVTYQGNLIEFEQHSETIDQNLIKPYFDKWDEVYTEKNMKDYI